MGKYLATPATKKCLGEFFRKCFSYGTQNGTGLGGHGSRRGSQYRVSSPVLIKQCLDLLATASCTLGSSPVMVIWDMGAGWRGLLQSCWAITGDSLEFDPRTPRPQGQSTAQCPSWWHLWQAVKGGVPWFRHCSAQCPACLQIWHLSCALSFRTLSWLLGGQYLDIPCLLPSFPFLGLGLPLLFSMIKSIGCHLDYFIQGGHGDLLL